MTPEERVRRRRMVRYGLFLLIVLAFVLTPTILYLAAASVLDIVWQTLVVVGIVLVVAVLVYYLYEGFLKRQ